jgi:hypothetical protein
MPHKKIGTKPLRMPGEVLVEATAIDVPTGTIRVEHEIVVIRHARSPSGHDPAGRKMPGADETL